ncbi:MAG: lysylphosphatidylglycerol synthase domain-containing protein [Candidatus Dormibacteraeota bacterium]|nr:lysylphosphatidylglycerol synthase domain-containing protein [Candidatus Dormibacteraeota bacterium]
MRTWRRRLLAVLREHWVAGAGLLAVAALVVAVNPGAVAVNLARADHTKLLLMLPDVLLLYVVQGVAWSIALRGLRAPVGLLQAIRVTFISQAFVFLPGGDLWRVPIVKSEDSRPVDHGALAASVIFQDLVFYFVLGLAMVPAALWFPLFRVGLAVALVPQAAIFAILLWPALYGRLVAWVTSVRPLRRFEPALAILGPSVRRLARPPVLIPIVVVEAVAAGLAIGLYALALAAVHVTGVGAGQVAFTYASGQIISGLTVLPLRWAPTRG